jgi:hypothetical protein
MKQFKKCIDILILLGSLLILSMGLGILYAEVATVNAEPLTSLPSSPAKDFATDKEMLNVLSANLSARNVKEIGGLIRRAPFAQRLRLVEAIIQNENIGLNRDDKLELLLYISRAARHKNKGAFFTLLIQNPDMLIGSPVLYHAAASGYKESISDLLTWLSHDPARKEKWATDAFAYAIEKNRPNVMQAMFEGGVAVSSKEATELLWQAIQHNASGQFASLLVKKGALINRARQRVTPLIAAVNMNNLDMVKALIDHGAEVNLIKDPRVGSALQKAIKKDYLAIEDLLRKRGARE